MQNLKVKARTVCSSVCQNGVRVGLFFVVALEIKYVQNAGLPIGDPKAHISSVILRGTPLMVKFC